MAVMRDVALPVGERRQEQIRAPLPRELELHGRM
jgi:hypothetical protein